MPDLDDEELRATRKLNGVEWKEDKEIQVGDYVRTRYGDIARIGEYRDEIVLDKEIKFHGIYRRYLCEDEIDFITKYSPNLIDLVECGDYVNGKLIHKVEINQNSAYIYYGNCKTFTDYQIKDIVTHEQFNSVMYKVKE